jgi:hypothetical protein
MADCVLPATTGETGGPSGQAESPINRGGGGQYLPIDILASAFPAHGPWPNKALQPTAYRVRSCVASASSGG